MTPLDTFMHTFGEWLLLHESVIKAHVPHGKQELKTSCGAAALKIVFQYFKVGPQSESEIRRLVKTSYSGTRTQNIIAACKKFGLKTKARYNMDRHELEAWLDKKKPVIVCLQAWGTPKDYKNKTSGHYVVAIGYDEKYVYFQDPLMKEKVRGHIPWDEFIKRWRDADADGNPRTRYGIAIWKDGPQTRASEVVKKSKKIK